MRTLLKLALFAVVAFAGIIVIAALVLPAPDQSASASEPAQAPPAQPAPERQWTEVASWTGNGMKETETFRTTDREWRIQWRSANEPFEGAGILQIYVYDGNGAMVTLAANRQGTGSDVSYVRSSPGPHYLMINSGNVDWTVTVEERR